MARPFHRNGRQQPGEQAALREHIPQKPGSGGFAVGPGDAAEKELLGGMVEVFCTGMRKGRAWIGNTNVAIGGCAHDGSCAALASIGDKAGAIGGGAGDRDKERTGGNGA